jgi:fructose/tagatose bisphosphate aldolase
MSLEPAVELLSHARRHRYAVGYFESWDVASLEGVIDAAEQSRAPIIVGFNGEFLSRPGRALPERLEYYGALGRTAAESARVPCAVMFNECPADDWVRRAIRLGFNLVMLADGDAAHANLTRRVADLVQVAHPQGVAVEAELGVLPCGAAEHAEAGKGDRTLLPGRPATNLRLAPPFAREDPVPFLPGSLTDPDLAAAFVRETGIDVLAVSVGNVHVLLDGERDLDLAHLAAIRQKVDVPFSLHGGSGIAARSLAEAISLGVAKINYGTYLKQRYLAALRQTLTAANGNPHHTLGYGGSADLLVTVRQAVRDAVMERIGLLGCCGKA